MNEKLLSVVIPVYNSEKTIKSTVERVIEAADTIKKINLSEIILVNDGSADSSLEECIKLCTKYEFVKLLNLSKNFGQHKALLAGLAKAKGEYILRMDDDLQTLPEEIHKLVECIERNNYDVVFAKYKNAKQDGFRRFGSRLNNMMANALIDKPKDVTLSSFCLSKKYVIDEMVKYDQAFPHIGGLVFRITKNVGNCYVRHVSRQYGKSNYTFSKLLGLWLNGFTNYSVKPLRISSLLGFIISIFSFILMIFVAIKKIILPNVEVGWTSIIMAISFFGGIQLLSIGLVGEYVGRIFMCINKTPQYVIKDSYNFQKREGL